MIYSIDSKNNSKVKYAVKISSAGARRRQDNVFFASSSKVVLDIIDRGFEIKALFCLREIYEKHRQKLKDYTVYIVSSAVRSKLSEGKTEDGMFGLFAMKQADESLIYSREKLLVLEDIQDPGNMGAIMRTALAFGYKNVVISEKCADIYSRKVIRSSMTASVKLNVLRRGDIGAFTKKLNDAGFLTVAACLENSVELGSEIMERPIALFIGNEGNGLSQPVISACKKRVKIPMSGEIESLNAAVSAAVLMWEAGKK